MNASKTQTLERITSLRDSVGFITFHLPQLESKYVAGVDQEIARAKQAGEKFNEHFEKHDVHVNYKRELRLEILWGCGIAASLGLDVTQCKLLAVSLGPGLFLPKPDDYVYGAMAELDSLLDAISATEPTKPKSPYPGLGELFAKMKNDAGDNHELVTKNMVALAYLNKKNIRTRPNATKPSCETIKNWIKNHGKHYWTSPKTLK